MIDFKNAQKAFEFYYNAIESNGVDFDGTKALFNIGFYIGCVLIYDFFKILICFFTMTRY